MSATFKLVVRTADQTRRAEITLAPSSTGGEVVQAADVAFGEGGREAEFVRTLEHGLKSRGFAVDGALFDEELHELFDEEGVPAAVLDDPFH